MLHVHAGPCAELYFPNMSRTPWAASCLLLLLLVVVGRWWRWARSWHVPANNHITHRDPHSNFLMTTPPHLLHSPSTALHPTLPTVLFPWATSQSSPRLPGLLTHPGRSCWLVGVCRQECEAQSNRERIINGNVYRNSENVSGIQKKNTFPLHSILGNAVDRRIDKTSGSGSCWRSGDAAYHVLCCPLVTCSHNFSRQLCRCRTNSEY